MEALDANILQRKGKCSWFSDQQRDDLRRHVRAVLEKGVCPESILHLRRIRDENLYLAAEGGGFDVFCTTYLGIEPGQGDALLAEPAVALDPALSAVPHSNDRSNSPAKATEKQIPGDLNMISAEQATDKGPSSKDGPLTTKPSGSDSTSRSLSITPDPIKSGKKETRAAGVAKNNRPPRDASAQATKQAHSQRNQGDGVAKVRKKRRKPVWRDAFVELDKIVLDDGLQIRAALNDETISDYAALMKEGTQFPLINLFQEHEGAPMLLADGFHRVLAARKAGLTQLHAVIKSGGRKEALELALIANERHGLRLTNADKNRAARMALEAFPDRSDAVIAKMCTVSAEFVRRVRAQLPTVGSCNPLVRLGLDGRKRRTKPAKVAAKSQESHAAESGKESPTATPGSTSGPNAGEAVAPPVQGPTPAEPSDAVDQAYTPPVEAGKETAVGNPPPGPLQAGSAQPALPVVAHDPDPPAPSSESPPGPAQPTANPDQVPLEPAPPPPSSTAPVAVPDQPPTYKHVGEFFMALRKQVRDYVTQNPQAARQLLAMLKMAPGWLDGIIPLIEQANPAQQAAPATDTHLD